MSQARINTPEDWKEKLVIAKEQYNQMKNLVYCREKTRGKHMHINYSQRSFQKITIILGDILEVQFPELTKDLILHIQVSCQVLKSFKK